MQKLFYEIGRYLPPEGEGGGGEGLMDFPYVTKKKIRKALISSWIFPSKASNSDTKKKLKELGHCKLHGNSTMIEILELESLKSKTNYMVR